MKYQRGSSCKAEQAHTSLYKGGVFREEGHIRNKQEAEVRCKAYCTKKIKSDPHDLLRFESDLGSVESS